MFDRFEREITYLRISVTDRCNLRCIYCVPGAGAVEDLAGAGATQGVRENGAPAEGIPAKRVPKLAPGDLLSFEEIAEIARAAIGLGVRKIRLTGGEPLVRRGIEDLAGMLKKIDGLEHLAMTTNGTLLESRARALKAAGLDSLNVSLDTLDPERYRLLTRGGALQDVLRGLRAARAEGFPMKINMVVMRDTSAEEIGRMREFCAGLGAGLQTINHFELCREKGDQYRFDRPPPCAGCNRVRLLADGTLKPCLHSDVEVKTDMSRIRESLRAAILAKPARGGVCRGRSMAQIGG